MVAVGAQVSGLRAGDIVATDHPEAVIATGFLAAGPWDYVGQVEAKSEILRRAIRDVGRERSTMPMRRLAR